MTPRPGFEKDTSEIQVYSVTATQICWTESLELDKVVAYFIMKHFSKIRNGSEQNMPGLRFEYGTKTTEVRPVNAEGPFWFEGFGSFNDAASSSDYTASNNYSIMNYTVHERKR